MIGNADGEVDKHEKHFLNGCLECMEITFDDLNEGFDKLSNGEVVRQILVPNA